MRRLAAHGTRLSGNGPPLTLDIRQAFIWPYDDRARLVGENLYEDPTSVQLEEVDPSEAITA